MTGVPVILIAALAAGGLIHLDAAALLSERDRTAASFISQNCSNHRKSVCPAVWANGRFKVGSRGPGACPIIIILLTTAPPDTGADFIRGQRRHRSRRATCRSNAICFADAGISVERSRRANSTRC